MKNSKILKVFIYICLSLLIFSNIYSLNDGIETINQHATGTINNFQNINIIGNTFNTTDAVVLNAFVNNVTVKHNFFNVSKSYISGSHSNDKIVLNDLEYGNYYGKKDGTGYSDICNDTNNDGICDLPYYPVYNEIIPPILLSNAEYKKMLTLLSIDYKPLAIWPYVVQHKNSLTYSISKNSVTATVYSDDSGTKEYNLFIEGTPFKKGYTNLSKGINNVSISFGDIKVCGTLNTTLKIGNKTITKVIDYGPCESAGGSEYSVPENPLYTIIVLIIGMLYLATRDKKQ